MIARLKRIFPEIALWAASAAATAVLFVVTFDTPCHSAAAGLLITSGSLLVTTTLFELIWQIVVDAQRDHRVKRQPPRR
jgi:hypothetical protein